MRQRTLSPRFFSDEDLVDLPHATRLLFAGLWCLADKQGRLEDRPRRIRIDLHLEGVDVHAALDDLADCGKVTRYEVDGTDYLCVNGFGKHQRPHPKETASVLPAPPAAESNGQPCISTASRGKQRPAVRFPSGPSEPSKPSGSSEPSEEPPPTPSPGVRPVFEAWIESTGKSAKLTSDRYRKVAARLREGFSVDELCDAARGWANDPWEGRRDQNDLAQLMRSGSTVEKFRDLWRNPRSDGGIIAQAEATARRLRETA